MVSARKNKIALLVLVLMGFFQGFCQNENLEHAPSTIVTLLGSENLQFVSEVQPAIPIANSNSVYIEQIGIDNIINTNIRAESSEINLVQNGNSNTVDLSVNAKTMVHNIMQNGTNNYLQEYSNTSNLNLERNIQQNGNDQRVVIYGSNTLTDNIILNLQGNSKTVTIRNFN
jgi:hypothetical protein